MRRLVITMLIITILGAQNINAREMQKFTHISEVFDSLHTFFSEKLGDEYAQKIENITRKVVIVARILPITYPTQTHLSFSNQFARYYKPTEAFLTQKEVQKVSPPLLTSQSIQTPTKKVAPPAPSEPVLNSAPKEAPKPIVIETEQEKEEIILTPDFSPIEEIIEDLPIPIIEEAPKEEESPVIEVPVTEEPIVVIEEPVEVVIEEDIEEAPLQSAAPEETSIIEEEEEEIPEPVVAIEEPVEPEEPQNDPNIPDIEEYGLSELRNLLADEINQHRGGRVYMNWSLNVVAQNYANYLCSNGVLEHVGPNGERVNDRIKEHGGYERLDWYGENLARGYKDIDDVVAGWLASGTHSATLKGGQYAHIGIGNCGTYWVTVFASQKRA